MMKRNKSCPKIKQSEVLISVVVYCLQCVNVELMITA